MAEDSRNKLPAILSPEIPVIPPVIRGDIPAIISDAGRAAQFAYDEFFFARLRNPHTRKAYRHSVHRFLAWSRKLGCELTGISPRHVGEYLDGLPFSVATKK